MRRLRTTDDLRSIIPEPHPIISAKIVDHLDEQARAFIAQSPFLVLSTLGRDGIELSPKGDGPGFVAVEDANTLVIPERAGNRLALGLQNILENDSVGVIFLLPGTPELLRVVGRAELWDDPEQSQRLAARGHPALLTIRVRVQRAYFQCSRAAKRSGLWNPADWAAPMQISFRQVLSAKLDEKELEQVAVVAKQDHLTQL